MSNEPMLISDNPNGIRVWMLQDTGTYVAATDSGWVDGEFKTVKEAIEYAESVIE